MARENLHFGSVGSPFMKSMIGAELIKDESLSLRLWLSSSVFVWVLVPAAAEAAVLDEGVGWSVDAALLGKKFLTIAPLGFAR